MANDQYNSTPTKVPNSHENDSSIKPSGNQSFDRAIRHLLEYHHVIKLGRLPAIDMSNRPKGIRSDRDWQFYYDALVSVIVIGKRNGWLTTHINRQGKPVFLVIEISQGK